MNKNTINERRKTDIGTGVQMSKYFNSQGNQAGDLSELFRDAMCSPCDYFHH